MSRPSLRDIDEWISWDQFLIELGLGLISPFMLPVTAFNAYHDWYYYHSGIYQEGDPPSRKFDADRARLHGASWTTGALGSYAYHSWMHPGKYPGLRTSSDVLKLVGHWAWESPTVVGLQCQQVELQHLRWLQLLLLVRLLQYMMLLRARLLPVRKSPHGSHYLSGPCFGPDTWVYIYTTLYYGCICGTHTLCCIGELNEMENGLGRRPRLR